MYGREVERQHRKWDYKWNPALFLVKLWRSGGLMLMSTLWWGGNEGKNALVFSKRNCSLIYFLLYEWWFTTSQRPLLIPLLNEALLEMENSEKWLYDLENKLTYIRYRASCHFPLHGRFEPLSEHLDGRGLRRLILTFVLGPKFLCELLLKLG